LRSREGEKKGKIFLTHALKMDKKKGEEGSKTFCL